MVETEEVGEATQEAGGGVPATRSPLVDVMLMRTAASASHIAESGQNPRDAEQLGS